MNKYTRKLVHLLMGNPVDDEIPGNRYQRAREIVEMFWTLLKWANLIGLAIVCLFILCAGVIGPFTKNWDYLAIAAINAVVLAVYSVLALAVLYVVCRGAQALFDIADSTMVLAAAEKGKGRASMEKTVKNTEERKHAMKELLETGGWSDDERQTPSRAMIIPKKSTQSVRL